MNLKAASHSQKAAISHGFGLEQCLAAPDEKKQSVTGIFSDLSIWFL